MAPLSMTDVERFLLRFWQAVRYYASGLYHRAGENHFFLMAGGLAFSLLVCIIPLVLVLFSALSLLLTEPSVAEEIGEAIDRLVPYGQYAESVKLFVADRIQEFSAFKNFAGVAGLVGLFFAASGLFSSLRTILNSAFRVRQPESVVVGKLWDLGLTLMVLLFFLVGIAVLPAWEAFQQLAENIPFYREFSLSGAGGFLLDVTSFATILVFFLMIYTLVPLRKPGKRTVLVSAVVAAVLWRMARVVFGVYISHAVTLKSIYGAYAFIIVVAFWIYYASLVLIVSAQVGQLYRERRAARRKSPSLTSSG